MGACKNQWINEAPERADKAEQEVSYLRYVISEALKIVEDGIVSEVLVLSELQPLAEYLRHHCDGPAKSYTSEGHSADYLAEGHPEECEF